MNNEDTCAKLNELIITLEQNQENQSYVDGIYQSFKDVLECEMNKYLNPRIIKVDGLNNKKKRTRKPWWNDELTQLWNDLCTHETAWLKCKNNGMKTIQKQQYVKKRKEFDRCVQRRKRQYWVEKQNELLNACENSDIFWKTIGKTGIGNERNRTIPMEIISENGDVIA